MSEVPSTDPKTIPNKTCGPAEHAYLPAADVPIAPLDANESSTEAKPRGTDEGKTVEARLAEIKQMFAGKSMSYFDMAESAREYHDLKAKEFAQSAQKVRVGHPGVISAMARELEIPGKSDAAKRAWLERALKVAKLSSEARDAAAKAKLDKNRSALIEIAEAGDVTEQLKTVARIEKRKAEAKMQAKRFIKKTVRLPVKGGDELLGALMSFAEKNGIQVI